MDPFDIHEDEDPSLLYICSPPRHEIEWTFEENKLFENCLAEFDTSLPNLFEKISTIIVSKTISEIKEHYEDLVEDLKNIESGLVPLPAYTPLDNESATEAKRSFHLRRRGVTWSDHEHQLFLHGLEIYGKGDWRSISRNIVKTRTPTQVASHAQKYFKGLKKDNAGPSN